MTDQISETYFFETARRSIRFNKVTRRTRNIAISATEKAGYLILAATGGAYLGFPKTYIETTDFIGACIVGVASAVRLSSVVTSSLDRHYERRIQPLLVQFSTEQPELFQTQADGTVPIDTKITEFRLLYPVAS